MRLNLERELFLKSWQSVERVAIPKSPVNAASGILISADEMGRVTLEATDSKTTSVKCTAQGVEVQEAGLGLIPVTIVGSLLKKSTSKLTTLEITNERGVISSGRNKTKFSVIAPSEFPQIPKSDNAEFFCEMVLSDFMKLSVEGSSASSSPQDFPKYLGTCLLRNKDGVLKFVSTDGKRLSISELACNTGNERDVMLPAADLKDLARILTSEDLSQKIIITSDGATAWFKVDEIEFSIRQIDTTFPTYEKILNDTVMASMIISRSDLSAALDRVDVIAKNNTAHIVAFTLNPNDELQIIARAPELGTTTEFVQANISGEFMRVGFNASYLQDGLRALGQGDIKIEFSDPEGQARLYRNNDDSFLYMLMPARLTPQDYMDDDNLSSEYENNEVQNEFNNNEQDQNQDQNQNNNGEF